MRALASIASAVSVTMFAQLAIDAVETAVLARLGAVQLAGATLAGSLYAVVFLFALGVVTAVTPLAAHAAGRGDAAALRRFGQNGIWAGLTLSVPLAGALALLAWSVTPHGAEQEAARTYLLTSAFGMPAWVAYVAVRCFAVATGRVRIATAIMAAALPIQAGLAILLAFGAGLGVAGVGIAYALTGFAALLLLAMLLAVAPQGAFGAAFRPPFRLDRAEFGAILRLGFPFAIRIVLREAVLPMAAILLAPFGAAALAAHAVASRVVQLVGVFAFGFSDAANMRVSVALGAGALDRARGAAWLAVLLALLVGLAAALGVVLGAHPLAGWLLGAGQGAARSAAIAVLPLAAALLLLEGVQSAASGALSGLRDARGTLLIAVLGGWVIALPLGAGLAHLLAAPAIGVWTGLCLGWTVATALTLRRLRTRGAGASSGNPGW